VSSFLHPPSPLPQESRHVPSGTCGPLSLGVSRDSRRVSRCRAGAPRWRAGHDPVFCHRYPNETCCVLVRQAWCKALGECSPWAKAQERRTVRSPRRCQHQGGRELGSDHMVSTSKPLQRRHEQQAEGAYRLGPKGEWPGRGALTSPRADVAPPAYGWDLRDPEAADVRTRGTPCLRPGLPGQANRKASRWSYGVGRWKKRMPSCNGADRASWLSPQGR
jgi:hypothetical protein